MDNELVLCDCGHEEIERFVESLEDGRTICSDCYRDLDFPRNI